MTASVIPRPHLPLLFSGRFTKGQVGRMIFLQNAIGPKFRTGGPSRDSTVFFLE